MQKHLPSVMVFIDFSKAFENIIHECMFSILNVYGIPSPVISAIKMMYDNIRVEVNSPDGDSEYFENFTGAMQGNTLSHTCL